MAYVCSTSPDHHRRLDLLSLVSPKLNIGVAGMIVAFLFFSALDNIDLCCIRMNVSQSILDNEGTKVEILLNNSLVYRADGAWSGIAGSFILFLFLTNS